MSVGYHAHFCYPHMEEKSMRRAWWLVALLTVLWVLVACERGGQTAAGLTVRIESPAEGARIPTGREVVITSTANSSTTSLVQKIELYINGELIREDVAPTQAGEATFTVEQRWVPTEAGTIAVEVIAYDVVGRRGTPATLSLVAEGSPMVTTAPFPSPTPTGIPVTPTTTPFPSPAPLPSATATVPRIEIAGTINTDANIRNGPGPTFDRIDGLFAGATVTAIGRNAAADWIEIRYGSGQTGWVLWSLAGWQGDIQQLSVTR
jgi:hypothetical protein